MRFFMRTLLGLILFAVGVGAAGYGGLKIKESFSARSSGGGGHGGRASGPDERVFSVRADRIRLETARPEITAYGEIRSWRSLEVRSSTGGYLVELTDAFRDGATVDKNALLFRIDPKDFTARVADARVALAEAKADMAEARQSLNVAQRELTASENIRDLRRSALERRRSLAQRGVSTSSQVEEAEMAVASAEQTSAGRSQALMANQARIDRGALKIQRAEIALAEAERDLADTEHRAPFSGLLSNVTAVLGSLTSPNERLGLLIDPTALEAVFRVTNAQFARLLDEGGALRPIPMTATLALDDAPLTVSGALDRTAAVIAAGETGRLIYARLDLSQATLLRPGDFVTVQIVEPPLQNVARLPSSAVSEAGEILLIDDDDRLTPATVRILRRTGDDVIVDSAPEGARYVSERAPQLGRGVKVKVIEIETQNGAPSPPPAPPSLVELAPEQQKKMIAFVEGNTQIPPPTRSRILTALKSGKAPQSMIDRITQRMGG